MATVIEAEHPIPQQISSYQFRLVGDMTLKQFFQVAGGAVVALVIYSSNLPTYVKWPLIIISFLFGVAFAFFPLQDRPLSKWLTLFIQAIYSPTIFLWKKDYVKPMYFQPEPDRAQEGVLPTVQPLPATKPEETIPQPVEVVKLEKGEKEMLQKVEEQFEKVEVEDKKEDKVIKEADTKIIEPQVVRSDQRIGDVKIPQTQKPEVEVSEKTEGKAPAETAPVSNDIYMAPTPVAGSANSANAQAAQFSPEAAPPAPPSYPNTIVGQVMTADGSIVENAILEIRDSNGRPVRALKSNKLGHFMIVTPLANGVYEILVEKEGQEFEPIKIEVSGQIVEPLIIKSKKLT